MFRRCFSSTSSLGVPRKFRLPTKYNAVTFPEGWDHTPRFKRIVSPQVPTSQQLSVPYITMKEYLQTIPRRKHLPSNNSETSSNDTQSPDNNKEETTSSDMVDDQRIRFAPRYPLPTTFAPGQDQKSWLAEITKQPESLTNDPQYYPYRYYEITMIRGLIGLPEKTKRIARSLGLSVVNQVVYRPVSERVAGNILKLKELVRIRLLNEIPERQPVVLGYRKIGNLIGKNISDL